MTTIHDVAARAGVSSATVSRVLNGHTSVNDDLAARVRSAIDDLDYRPSIIARSMRTQRTGVVAVVVPDVENPFFTSVVRGVEDVARDHGLMAVLCNSDDQPEVERRYLNTAVDQRMDGVMLASSVETAEQLPARATAQYPIILVDRLVPAFDSDSVVVDNRRGAVEATGHLLAAGARRPACVTGPRGVFTAEQRAAGFTEALVAAGHTPDPTLVVHADFRVTGGMAATAALLAHPDGPPDALFVGNNAMTLGALTQLAAAGLRVPRDLLLVGYDDEPWASAWNPAITTVAQPARELGQTAMQLLIDRLEDPDRPTRSVVLEPTLIVRDSSVRPAG